MVEVTRLSVIAVLLLAPGIAAAQLVECPELGGGTDTYKVVMDDLTLPTDGPAAEGLQQLKERLAFTLSTQLQEFQSDVVTRRIVPSIDLGVINCVKRRPTLSGSEFNQQRIKKLNDQRVVVELWGNLAIEVGDTSRIPQATIGYLIPPIFMYLQGQQISWKFTARYPKTGGRSADTLQKLPEASAFAMLGLGIKARRALNYDLAVWAFGRSEASIKQAQDFGNPTELAAFLSYVKLAACEARETARADSDYAGPISLTPKETCGAAI
jgi:hypothetical protein